MTTLPNIPRLYTGLAEALACFLIWLVLKQNLRKSNSGWILLFTGTIQILLQLWVGEWSLILWVPGMLLNLVWMFLAFSLSENVQLTVRLYHLCKAFIIAEFWAALSWQFFCQFKFPKTFLTELLFMLSCYASLFGIFLIIQHHFKYQYALLNINLREVAIAAISACMIFSISNLGFIFPQNIFGSSINIFTIRTFIDLCGILILLLQENQRYENYLKNDLASINNLFQSQYKQYQTYLESSQLINQKFHDLKHQIDAIILENNAVKRQETLNKLKAEIMQYHSLIKTGNPIVDVILTNKNTYCIQNNITLTCFVDGKLLNKIGTIDLCSLIGNSLDNAIESVEKVTQTERRIITLRVQKKAGFVLYLLENYTLNHPAFINELPQTTKKNQNFHGYGLKSIRYLTQRNHGKMQIEIKDNWFKLKILFPLESQF